MKVRLFQPVEANNSDYDGSIIAQFDTALFMTLVHSACHRVQEFVNPQSSLYVEPADNVGEQFQFLSDRIQKRHPYPIHIWGQTQYIEMTAQLSIVEAYIKWRNAYGDRCVVGEEWWTFHLVYTTMVFFNNWKVHCIEDSHRKNGPNWGTATDWQIRDPLENVRDWPERFNFHKHTGWQKRDRGMNAPRINYLGISPEYILTLPCKRIQKEKA
jgi:hypothetical protein